MNAERSTNRAPDPDAVAGTSLAEKLSILFETVYPPGQQRRYSDKEVAAAINARTAARGDRTTVSNVYVWQLRTGRRLNPSYEVLKALAEHFEVPAAFFFDTTESAAIERDLLALKGMRDLRVRAVAARMAEMPDESLSAVGDIVERVYRALQQRAGTTSEPPDSE